MNTQELLEYDYLEYKQAILNQGYSEQEFSNCFSVYNYFAENVFEICTYENIVAALMSKDFLTLATAISNNKTFDLYDTQPEMYMRTINYDFFMSKISWGSSIRGAWWDFNETVKVLVTNIGEVSVVTEKQMSDFINELNLFVEKYNE